MVHGYSLLNNLLHILRQLWPFMIVNTGLTLKEVRSTAVGRGRPLFIS